MDAIKYVYIFLQNTFLKAYTEDIQMWALILLSWAERISVPSIKKQFKVPLKKKLKLIENRN